MQNCATRLKATNHQKNCKLFSGMTEIHLKLHAALEYFYQSCVEINLHEPPKLNNCAKDSQSRLVVLYKNETVKKVNLKQFGLYQAKFILTQMRNLLEWTREKFGVPDHRKKERIKSKFKS